MATSPATDNRTLLGVGSVGVVGVGGDTDTIPQAQVADSIAAPASSASASAAFHATVGDTTPVPVSAVQVDSLATVEPADTVSAPDSTVEVNVVRPTVRLYDGVSSPVSASSIRFVQDLTVSESVSAPSSSTNYTLTFQASASDAVASPSSHTSVYVVPAVWLSDVISAPSDRFDATIYPYPASLWTMSDGRRAPVFTYDDVRVPVYLGLHA